LRSRLHRLARAFYPQLRHPVAYQPFHRPLDLILALLKCRSLVELARLIANHIRLLHGLLAIARDHFFSCCPDALVELLLQVLGILVDLRFSVADVCFSCGQLLLTLLQGIFSRLQLLPGLRLRHPLVPLLPQRYDSRLLCLESLLSTGDLVVDGAAAQDPVHHRIAALRLLAQHR